jgi:hypothetical protein
MPAVFWRKPLPTNKNGSVLPTNYRSQIWGTR